MPPEDLRIGRTCTSPYQTTLGPEITRVPNSTGMGASWEAMGTSLSPIWPGWASCTLGRGASSADSTVVTTQMMICCHMGKPHTMASPVKGFFTGMKGKPPKLSRLPNLSLQCAMVWSQPA